MSNTAELALTQEFVATKSDDAKLSSWERYALALLGSNEFLFVD